jgi:hypothetical protein
MVRDGFKESGAEAPHPDGLRLVADLNEPDIRMRYLAVLDGTGSRPLEQTDRHALIAQYELLGCVPEDVRVHFDTARNLYLYAWNVYRFHAIAEHQVLGSLEMALRTKLIACGSLNDDGLLETVFPPRKKKLTDFELTPRRVMLKQMLGHAAEVNLISNDRIVNRARWMAKSVEFLQLVRMAELMEQQGLTEMRVEPLPIVLSDEDVNHDWIGGFIDALPGIRNDYAHGSPRINASVLRTFDICSDLINQLFGADTFTPANV